MLLCYRYILCTKQTIFFKNFIKPARKVLLKQDFLDSACYGKSTQWIINVANVQRHYNQRIFLLHEFDIKNEAKTCVALRNATGVRCAHFSNWNHNIRGPGL
jgi:hypothetical protein